MPTFASITPTSETDGVPYCTSAVMPFIENDLGAPLSVVYGQLLVAVVQLSITGFITANNTYVVLQTDMGDGVWIDVAWLVFNQTQGSATFVLQGGVPGTSNNSFQQTRNAGSPPNPQANGSNAMALAGRCRFVGKTTTAGGSSSPAGPVQVLATIKYKLLAPR